MQVSADLTNQAEPTHFAEEYRQQPLRAAVLDQKRSRTCCWRLIETCTSSRGLLQQESELHSADAVSRSLSQ